MNAKIKIKNLKRKINEEPVGDIFVKTSALKPINCNKEIVPYLIDELPILFIIAALTKGVSKFNGIHELRHKESDRIKTMENGLNKIGIKTKSTRDTLKIFGNPNVRLKKILNIHPKGDHRIAMSWAIFGLLVNAKIKINNFETVKTSFPNFISLIKSIGGKIEVKR